MKKHRLENKIIIDVDDQTNFSNPVLDLKLIKDTIKRKRTKEEVGTGKRRKEDPGRLSDRLIKKVLWPRVNKSRKHRLNL